MNKYKLLVTKRSTGKVVEMTFKTKKQMDRWMLNNYAEWTW